MLATAFKGLSLTSSSSLLGGRPCQAGTTHRPLPLQRSPVCPSIEAAHKKGGGSTKNGRDSNAQRRGCKAYGGQPIQAGAIIYRQLGTKWHAGDGVGMGKDFTLFAKHPGIVVYQQSKYIRKVHVVPRSAYVVPEGNRVKAENSRKTQRKKEFPPRALLREQFERDVAEAPISAQPQAA